MSTGSPQSHRGESLLAQAQMITADADPGTVVALTTTTTLLQPPSEVELAHLVATAHGVYEARVNSTLVSLDVLSPGWTSYEWRLAWQEYDVTQLIGQTAPEVSLRFHLGNGWYRGGLGPWNDLNYGDTLGILATLEIRYRDGQIQTISTSPTWLAETTEITQNSLYHGQHVDARLRSYPRELSVRAIPFDTTTLVRQTWPPVKRLATRQPERIWQSESGSYLVDFGQNLVGWLRFQVSGSTGQEIIIRHAEALEGHTLATAPLRDAEATDKLILSGGEDFFEPTFTFHGFRYVEISGWPGELTQQQLLAVVVGSDLHPTGTFECSDARVNQLASNSVWGQRGNFLSVPTDCPQRDERLGWTGDIAVYARTAAYQCDVADFLDNWLSDVAVELQHNPSGQVPWTVPDIMKYRQDPEWNRLAAVWNDAAVWVPEALWEAYGDLDRLARHFPLMEAHLHSVEKALSPTGLWDEGFQFGDWLDPDTPPQDATKAKADPAVVATASLYRSAHFTAQAARLLGNGSETHWQQLADRTREAFNAHYVDEGIIRSDCPTVYALALRFGLLTPGHEKVAAARLSELVQAASYRATTGFAGTPFITWALSEHGYVDDAYRLLLEEGFPSWLYQVAMGATTTWERWDSVLPDGTLNDPVMTSLNHYAFGAVCDWLYGVVAGIRPAAPGYRRILLHPRPGSSLTWVKASHESPVGRIEVEWRQDAGMFSLEARLPEGVEIEVVLPDGTQPIVTGGTHSWTART